LNSAPGEAQRAASSAGGNTQLLPDIAVRNQKIGLLWFLDLTFSPNFGVIAGVLTKGSRESRQKSKPDHFITPRHFVNRTNPPLELQS
jgi:hypothetical protein